jgi:hypothetical protein
MKFKNTQTAWSRLLVAARRLAAAARTDLSALRPPQPSAPAPAGNRSVGGEPKRPAIFVSYATDEALKGSHRYCGGEKLLNNLVLLLRRHGYDAWMVSVDGKNAGWLTEHAPFLSLAEFREKLRAGGEVRCVTSWVTARAFLEHCPKFYLWDQELGASSRSQFPLIARLMAEGRIVQTAGVNRAVQAFHTAVFERRAHLLRQLVDEKHWRPAESGRVRNRIGYFEEGDHTAEFIRVIRERTKAQGFDLEFVELRGDEPVIIRQMQECGVFLALNIGKSLLWGEGGPMSPQEAMACGTVPVTFDMNGPWEVIQQNYNGVVTPEIRPELMAEALCGIYGTAGRLEEMSRRCVEMTRSSHTMEARWPDVRRFLDLPCD